MTREGNLKDGCSLSNSLGALLINQGRLDEAVNYISSALEIGEVPGDRSLQVQSLKLFAPIFKRRGDEEKAILYLERAKGLESGGE